MFIASLVIITKNWKQCKWPLTGKQTNKTCYNQAMEYYSLINRNKLLIHKTSQVHLKCIIFSESKQSQKTTGQLLYL